ncbi:phosphoribosylglycinamide formyltransferase [Lacihabitans soyangensis]|uniref:Phosphoribosylglycinamide formyltransferase n=1 Tax=Lacihabitans soyangensis TaxID=869394 RepID=A0AAE3KTL9_9BACT|nr:phosphoribosylglycinamide formyltransferase [Lacihabitans soyangensis]MCP9764587.1 phosphoribosylglycinamide formyltransferase [Lacihabitans soyangensis]
MIKIAIFASGSGSNAERIVEYFSSNNEVEVCLILTNNPTAGVIERAQRLNVPTLIFNKKLFAKTGKIVEILQSQKIDWVILAGFLWLVPNNLTRAFENRMINIHPALLPKYGGKGMWGHHVHEAVVANQETETGITIHYVNEHYDEGKIIFQAKCEVTKNDTADDVAQKIHQLEYQYFPEVIHKEILSAK